VNAVAINSASPSTVRSTWRSDTKIAAGRQRTSVAGITAIVKQAIASPRPITISKEVTSTGSPSLTSAARRRPTCWTGFVTGTFGAITVGFGFAFAFRCTFFGLACGRGVVGVDDGCECTTGAGVTGWDRRAGAGAGTGFGFGFGAAFGGGAGSGSGTGSGTIVVVGAGGSSALAAKAPPPGSARAAAVPATPSAMRAQAKETRARREPLSEWRRIPSKLCPSLSTNPGRSHLSHKRADPQGPPTLAPWRQEANI
jgi:hypothetical protein